MSVSGEHAESGVGSHPRPPTALTVLVVCPSNAAASPVAEFALRHAAAHAGLAVAVTSAGVIARPGTPMTDAARAVVQSVLQSDPGGWTRTALTVEAAAAADLVLTSDTATRSAVIALYPAVLRRCVTLLEWERLRPHLAPIDAGPDGLREALAAGIAVARGRLQPSRHAHALDLEDPQRLGRRGGRQVLDTVVAACTGALAPFRSDRNSAA